MTPAPLQKAQPALSVALVAATGFVLERENELLGAALIILCFGIGFAMVAQFGTKS